MEQERKRPGSKPGVQRGPYKKSAMPKLNVQETLRQLLLTVQCQAKKITFLEKELQDIKGQNDVRPGGFMGSNNPENPLKKRKFEEPESETEEDESDQEKESEDEKYKKHRATLDLWDIEEKLIEANIAVNRNNIEDIEKKYKDLYKKRCK